MIEVKVKSVIKKYLDKKQISKICKLKNQHWNYGLNSNLAWFKKNINKNDVNNILLCNKKIIGYTLLRKRLSLTNRKKKRYLYFDTMIIDKKFRKRGFGSFLMFFNNDTIIQLKTPSILICKDHLVHFYKRFGWTIMKNEHVNLKDHQASNDYKNSKVNCMGFNGANMKKTDYYLYKYF